MLGAIKSDARRLFFSLLLLDWKVPENRKARTVPFQIAREREKKKCFFFSTSSPRSNFMLRTTFDFLTISFSPSVVASIIHTPIFVAALCCDCRTISSFIDKLSNQPAPSFWVSIKLSKKSRKNPSETNKKSVLGFFFFFLFGKLINHRWKRISAAELSCKAI